jgi:hypothetical protein
MILRENRDRENSDRENRDRQHLIWETALDRLELDVMRAEQMASHPASHDVEPWDEPHLDGPVPNDLVERALELRARQQQAQAALASALAALGRQHAFADRVDRATALAARPVYVDVSA